MSTFDRQAILDHLSRLVTPGIKLTALADDLGLRKQDYSELRAQIRVRGLGHGSRSYPRSGGSTAGPRALRPGPRVGGVVHGPEPLG